LNIKNALYYFLSGGLILLTFLVIYPFDISLFERLSEYSVQYIFLLLGFWFIFLIIDQKKLMFVALGSAAILCVFLKKHSNYNLILPLENQQPSISVAHYNLSNITCTPEIFLEEIKSTSAELISFQEYNPFWDKFLSTELTEHYQECLKVTRIDPFGTAIFSKLPLKKKDTLYSSEKPGLLASIELGNEEVDIYSTYIIPSLNGNSNEQAQNQLSKITSQIKQNMRSTIVLGEFNDVYWSNNIRNFRADNKLFNSRRNTIPGSFEVPYDHIFYTSDLECTYFQEINGPNNDKIGILGRYQLRLNEEDFIRAALNSQSI
jgi:endonuclease/exonuclease/phosphatase (EEP) superfamily protein YafD